MKYLEKYIRDLEAHLGVDLTKEKKGQLSRVLNEVYEKGYYDGTKDAQEALMLEED